MKSNTYWLKRFSAQRMYEYQKNADDVADDVAKAYIKATDYISSEISKIFRTFQIDCGISEEDAKKLLDNLPDEVSLNNLKEVIQTIEDPQVRREMLNVINSPAYAYRIRRLESLQNDIDTQINDIAELEEGITSKHHKDLADYAYNRTIFDIQRGTGIGFAFDKMPKSRVTEILKQNWSGKLFSERIWGRSEEINTVLKRELLTGFMTGRSYAKTAKAIQEQMEVGAYEARRLVRTESTYIANSAEMESYRNTGVDKYRFIATLDIRTSEICASLDNKVFDVADAVPGENMPPMHPWCRSTTIAELGDEMMKTLTRAARDPVTGEQYKIPANMTYEEWKKEVDKKHGDGTFDKIKNLQRKRVKNIDKFDGNGIISMRGESILNVRIDKFTPCLENAKTGEIIATSYSRVDNSEIKKLSGWKFDWAHPSLNNTEIYKLTLKNDNKIQGLIALTKYERDHAIYVNIAESAAENMGKDRAYNGVGGHLFAIAAQRSVELGYGGFVFMDAKNQELVQHYKKTLGATLLGRPHPNRMFIDEDAAKKLLEIYTLEED